MFKSKKKVGSTTAPENLRTIALSAFISNDLSSTLIIPTNAQKKDKEAISYYDRALECVDSNMPISNLDAVLTDKGVSFGNLKQHQQALDCFDEALEINDKNIDSLFGKAVMLESLGRYEETLVYYDKVLNVNPNHPYVPTRKQNLLDFLEGSGGRHYDSDGKVV